MHRLYASLQRPPHFDGRARFLVLAAAIACLLPASPAVGAAGFRGLGDLPGGSVGSWATAVSANGRVVVGSSRSALGSEAFRWSRAEGMTGLGDFPPNGTLFDPDDLSSSKAYDVSADGSVIVGHGTALECPRGACFPERFAFRWSEATGMVSPLPGVDPPNVGQPSTAYGVSDDGSVVVGSRWEFLGNQSTFAFGVAGPNPFNQCCPEYAEQLAASADGLMAVGHTQVGAPPNVVVQAFRWRGAASDLLGALGGASDHSRAVATSADGSVVVGVSSSSLTEGFHWTEASGMLSLGSIQPDDLSADGSLVVGSVNPEPGIPGGAAMWDDSHQIRLVKDVLENEHGLDLTGWQLTRATGVSADGLVIVGEGVDPAGNPQAWLARLPRLDCADGVDNDGDGLTDYPADPGCSSASDPNEVASCGLGVELLLLTPLFWLAGRRRRAAASRG